MYFIWQFVYNHKNLIDSVTIIRDIASTGSGEYYRSRQGIYNHMPVDDFITEKGNPVIEWKNKLPSVRRHLALGGRIKDIEKLPINPDRAMRDYERLLDFENSHPCFWQDIDYVVNTILDGQPINKVISEYVTEQ